MGVREARTRAREGEVRVALRAANLRWLPTRPTLGLRMRQNDTVTFPETGTARGETSRGDDSTTPAARHALS